MTEIRASADYCEYRGMILSKGFGGGEWVGVDRPKGSTESDFPDAVAFGEDESGLWVKLPRSCITRAWYEAVYATWQGVTVDVTRTFPDGRVTLAYQKSPQVAEALGMNGDQYNGWAITVPAEELTNIWIKIEDREP